ncbi:MAG TPA: condensation domain-containing protein, partial [Candidatus Deferrimicrobium sp.]|nr:condensation domain-containing protein [Candidatus Deferrimicrobium sp.]
NFFELGGDSIKAIQIASKLPKYRLKLELKDLFLNPTIRGASQWAKAMASSTPQEQGPVSGDVPLTPMQHRFFEIQHRDHTNHYNQSVMLYRKNGFEAADVEKTLDRLAAHHDALRMVFTFMGNVKQFNKDLSSGSQVPVYDLRARTEDEEVKQFIEETCNQIQGSIDLAAGPLLKTALFKTPAGDYLAIIIHHLVVDGISWRILLEDLEAGYRQVQDGAKIRFPDKTDSFKLWSEKLTAYADSKTFLSEKTYWQTIESAGASVPPIPKDFTAAANDSKDSREVSFILGEEDTRFLLTRVNQAFKTEINDILLTALGMGVKQAFGNDRVLIALESHGREEIFAGVDINRTVGWFTSLYPVLMDISYAHDLPRQVIEIKETLRRIPNKGIGYGILKYLTRDENKKGIRFQLAPPINFNYLGQFNPAADRESFFEISALPAGNNRHLNGQREFDLEITGMIADNRLTMVISYNQTHYQAGTIARLSENFQSALTSIIAFCSARDHTEYTPADFTYKGLSIESVNRLLKAYPAVEDIYTLTPMQEGMLFHALVDETSYSYFEQISYRLIGELAVPLVEKSVNELFQRHDILRTVFVHQDIEVPVQVVLKERAGDFYYRDISQDSEEEKEETIVKLKEADKKRSFNLSKDVLMRISILKTGEREPEYEFIWSYHHILMDGWCIGILNREFFEIYTGYLENRPHGLPAVKPYRTYIQWLARQDKEESAQYWKNYLDSYEDPSSVPRASVSTGMAYKNETLSAALDPEKTTRLHQLAARAQVTLNTVVQVLWGILLGKYNRKEDVVFGAVVSGRPFQLAGVETMVGLFINTVPVRIRWAGDMKFRELFQQVQIEAAAGEPHHYFPLAEIQAMTALKQNLIDHILVFENYPVAGQIEQNVQSLKLVNVEIFEQTNYDFNVIIAGIDRLTITFQYNGNSYCHHDIEQVAGRLLMAIDHLLENEALSVSDLTLLSAEEKQQLLYDFNNTASDYPADKTIPQLFIEQVAKIPDSIALVGADPRVC